MERHRVTVQEAARILGVKEPAIRKRVKRGTLDSERVGNRVYVYLDMGQSEDQSEERSSGTHPPIGDRDELLEELRRQNEYLREENRRKDHIIAALVERMPPQIEAGAPPEPRESPVASGPRDAPPEAAGEAHAPSEAQEEGPEERRLPWWRRWFGG